MGGARSLITIVTAVLVLIVDTSESLLFTCLVMTDEGGALHEFVAIKITLRRSCGRASGTYAL